MLTHPVLAQLTILHPNFELVNSFPVPDELDDPMGDILFSEDGSIVWVIEGSESDGAAVFTATVTRDSEGNVTGFGTFTQVFAFPNLDTGLIFSPAGDALFFFAEGIGHRQTNGTIEVVEPDSDFDYGGLAFLPPGYPNAGDILFSSYNENIVYQHGVTADGDGSYTVEALGTSWADLSAAFEDDGQIGDIILLAQGLLAGNAMIAVYGDEPDASEPVTLVYFPVGADGLPAGSGAPTPTTFATGVPGAWGVSEDPVTGNLWLVDFDADPGGDLAFYQIAGPDLPAPATPVPTLGNGALVLLVLVFLIAGGLASRRNNILAPARNRQV